MMIGIGIDIVQVARIEKLIINSGARFLDRIFTKDEQTTCETRKEKYGAYAKRFAAKEACAKALGCGIGADALFKEIEVSNNSRGAPQINLYGSALEHLIEHTPMGYRSAIFLTLSDEKEYAIAQVIIEGIKT